MLQLRALQAVSGYAADEDEAGGGAGGAPAPGSGRAGLEVALAAKSRQLEHKQTMLRLELAEARGAMGCRVRCHSCGRAAVKLPDAPSRSAASPRCLCYYCWRLGPHMLAR